MAEPKFKNLTSAQFIAGFALRLKQYAWFLGAGASASSGIPTGYMMILDFKTRLFCRETGLPRREVDSTDPLWVKRIDEFFRKRSLLPPPGDPSEYAAAFEAVYPTELERRQYIDDAIHKGTPSFAHRVLASLISTRHIQCIFTTNFDQLVETACTQTDLLLPADERALPTVAALDSVDRADRCLRESDWPLVAKLHGDYTSTQLKNTTAELELQDEKMRTVLNGACQRFGLIVVGYSGRDISVMQALEAALQTPGAFPGGIYWVTRSKRDLLPAVQQLLDRAVLAGVTVAVVQAQTFDELAADLVNQITLPDVLHRHILERRPPEVLRPVPLPIGDARKFPVLRCSALLIRQMPLVARRLTLVSSASTAKVRELLKEAKVYAVAASMGREVAAFGPDDQLVAALASLGARLDGTIELKPDVDSWALGLLYDALTKALCRNRPLFARLRRAGHAVLVASGKPGEDEHRTHMRQQRLARLQHAYESSLSGTVPELGFPYTEGVRLRLEHCANRWWCVFDPFTFIDFPKVKEAPTEDEDSSRLATMGLHNGDPAGDWRRERWATKYNRPWTNIIDAWADLLCTSEDDTIRAFGTTPETGMDAVFGMSSVTAWSRPAHHHAYFERQR